MDTNWKDVLIVFIVAVGLVTLGYLMYDCTVKEDANRKQKYQRCIDKTQKPLECKVSLEK